MGNLDTLIKSLSETRAIKDEPMARHTTLKIGGRADVYYGAKNSDELIGAVRLARNLDIPVTVIGGGSNILVGDGGIRGLVVKNSSDKIAVGGKVKRKGVYPDEVVQTRWQTDSVWGSLKYEFKDLDYDEWDEERIEVALDSGVGLQGALWSLLDQGITGLQWYARIPGTVGGAVFNNIHGGSHTVEEIIERVSVLTKEGEIRTFLKNELALGYDESRFHRSGEIITEVVLDMFLGDKRRASKTAREWARRKEIQPTRSAGCVFKNISDADQERLGYPTQSAGFLIEHILKMGGYRVGGAVVSTAHHNFIVNDGGASAADFLAVQNEIVRRSKETAGIDLESEIVFMGEY